MGLDQKTTSHTDSSEGPRQETFISSPSQQDYRVLFELAFDGILIGNSGGVVLEANEAVVPIFGMRREAIIGRHVSNLPFTSESIVQKPFRFDLVAQGKNLVTERDLVRPDSTHVTVEMRTGLMPNGNIFCFVRDITDRKREETALRESENRYRQLFEAESDAIFLIDNDEGNIIEVNSAAVALYGYTREELISLRNVDLSAEPESTQQATHGAPFTKGNVIYIPLRFHRKADGSIFPVEITARSFRQAGRSVHIAAIRDITDRKRVEDELRESSDRLKQLAETLEIRVLKRTQELEAVNLSLEQTVAQLRKLAMDLTQAEEHERKRLALLLHDHLQPFLVAATMKVSLLASPVQEEEQTRLVHETQELIKSAIDASRSLTMDLFPPILLDAGIIPGLCWLADWIGDKYGLDVEISCEDELKIPKELGPLVFLTIRELLFNVAKHAKTDKATVTLNDKTKPMLQIIVEDQGGGFPENGSQTSSASTSMGLFRLRERLLAIGGALDVASRVGVGTKVHVSIPIPDEPLSKQGTNGGVS